MFSREAFEAKRLSTLGHLEATLKRPSELPDSDAQPHTSKVVGWICLYCCYCTRRGGDQLNFGFGRPFSCVSSRRKMTIRQKRLNVGGVRVGVRLCQTAIYIGSDVPSRGNYADGGQQRCLSIAQASLPQDKMKSTWANPWGENHTHHSRPSSQRQLQALAPVRSVFMDDDEFRSACNVSLTWSFSEVNHVEYKPMAHISQADTLMQTYSQISSHYLWNWEPMTLKARTSMTVKMDHRCCQPLKSDKPLRKKHTSKIWETCICRLRGFKWWEYAHATGDRVQKSYFCDLLAHGQDVLVSKTDKTCISWLWSKVWGLDPAHSPSAILQSSLGQETGISWYWAPSTPTLLHMNSSN